MPAANGIAQTLYTKAKRKFHLMRAIVWRLRSMAVTTSVTRPRISTTVADNANDNANDNDQTERTVSALQSAFGPLVRRRRRRRKNERRRAESEEGKDEDGKGRQKIVCVSLFTTVREATRLCIYTHLTIIYLSIHFSCLSISSIFYIYPLQPIPRHTPIHHPFSVKQAHKY